MGVDVRKLLVVVGLVVTLTIATAGIAQANETVRATGSNTFNPGTARIHDGERVTWKNVSSQRHSVTATSNNWGKNTTIRPNRSTSSTFNNEGTYRYKCRFHAGMTGKVVVS